MGVNTLNDRTDGQTITQEWFNSIHQAANTDLVGRNASGVPTAGQALGTVAFPWGTVRAQTLILNGNVIDTSSITSPPNRVVSGATRAIAGSNLPQFLVPNGAALSAVVDGTPTNLLLSINGVEVTVSTDITKTGLTAAPTSNNTCLVNDTDAAGQFETRYWGETNQRRSSITIDTAGSEITGLIGKWAAFKIGTEYFIAFVKSSTELTNCFRGAFYNSGMNPQKPVTFSNNDTITLMKLTWWFIENDGTTVDVTYTNPVWAFESPSGPASGDYWYDMGNNLWKRYDGASWVQINRTFVGWTVQDGSACVAARCEEFYGNFEEKNTLKVVKSTTEIAVAKHMGAMVNVAGTTLMFRGSKPVWNITTDLAPTTDMHDATEQASRLYWLYLKQNGDTVISDIAPMIREDLMGRYHRYNTWRCVGWAYNDATSDFTGAQSWGSADGAIHLHTDNGFDTGFSRTRRYQTAAFLDNASFSYEDSVANGSIFTCLVDGLFWMQATDIATDIGLAVAIPFGILRNPVIGGGEGPTGVLNDTAGNRGLMMPYATFPEGYADRAQGVVWCKVGDQFTPTYDGGLVAAGTGDNISFSLVRIGGKDLE